MKTHYYCDEIVEICDDKHLTVDEIFEQISAKYPDAGRSSIYRNVEELVKKWDLKKITWIGKKAYFEKNKWCHIHLIDKNTGEIMDLAIDVTLPNLPKNFTPEECDMRIYGEFAK